MPLWRSSRVYAADQETGHAHLDQEQSESSQDQQKVEKNFETEACESEVSSGSSEYETESETESETEDSTSTAHVAVNKPGSSPHHTDQGTQMYEAAEDGGMPEFKVQL